MSTAGGVCYEPRARVTSSHFVAAPFTHCSSICNKISQQRHTEYQDLTREAIILVDKREEGTEKGGKKREKELSNKRETRRGKTEERREKREEGGRKQEEVRGNDKERRKKQ